MEKSSRIEGVFLSFTPEELSYIDDRLEFLGYGTDRIQALREVIFDCLDEKEESKQKSDRIDNVRDFIATHPEAIQAGLSIVKNLLKKKAG